MNAGGHKPQVFISHSSTDTWVAKQIAAHIKQCGAEFFLDAEDIEHGDDFEKKILEAAQASSELLVLITPWATLRPYIWLEMGVFWGSGKRIVGVLHGITAKEIASDERIPILLKRIDLLDINRIDSYFDQLRARLKDKQVSS
jgi:hypothetical protein